MPSRRKAACQEILHDQQSFDKVKRDSPNEPYSCLLSAFDWLYIADEMNEYVTALIPLATPR